MRLLTTLVVTLWSLFATGATASAETYVHQDTSGDVLRQDSQSCGDGCQGTSFPRADILSSRASYRAKGLTLSTVLAQAPKVGQVEWRVKTPSLEIAFEIYEPKSGPLECLVVFATDDSQLPAACTGFRVGVTREGRVFRAFIPSRYLKSAPSVRVGIGSTMSSLRGLFFDDGLTTRVRHAANPVLLHLSPTIRWN
ncbi:MAG: hypothetical protein QOD98_2386 [Nocardioidaceae bacterium]|nr:hypothetical protein [Nocardioidaceae bacterium]